MRSSRIDEIREAELFYTAQSLKWTRLQDAPQRAFELIVPELNEIMQGVADSLERHV